MEEIQDQIAICAKWKIKVKKEKGNKSPNKKGKIKVQKEKGNKSPNKKGEIKVQIKIGESKLVGKKSFLRSRCKIAIKNRS